MCGEKRSRTIEFELFSSGEEPRRELLVTSLPSNFRPLSESARQQARLLVANQVYRRVCRKGRPRQITEDSTQSG
jgi:hypothetical protein